MIHHLRNKAAQAVGIGLLAASSMSLTARAQSEDCMRPAAIPGFVAAEPSDRPAMRYPREALNAWSEGWVLLEYAVTAKGEPRDMTVIDALGPKDFVKVAVDGVSKWRYKPATRNGVAVEQSLVQVSVLFLFTEFRREADHGAFVRKYNKARSLLRDEKPDEAIAVLEEAFQHRLNLYESAMGSFVLAFAYAQKHDWETASFHIGHATIESEKYLERGMRPHARALEVELAARTGNFKSAVCGFEALKKSDPEMAAPGTQLATVIANIDAAMKDPKPLAIEARLAKHPLVEDAPAVWRHQLLRSKFWFAEPKGDVQSFRLACVGTAHNAPVDTETLWDVPAKAGPCILRVEGVPGATFKLVEEW